MGMYVSEVRYSLRLTLGDYQHEELEAKVLNDPDDLATGDEMMKEARRVVVSQTTRKLKEQKRGK